MKEKLIKHLKTKSTKNIHALWSEAKSYYKDRLIEMGGGYASIGDSINVVLNIDGELERFKVSIEECK